jgi:hypothetical protein
MKKTMMVACAISVFGFLSADFFNVGGVSFGITGSVQAEDLDAPSCIMLPDGSRMGGVYSIKGTISDNSLNVMGLKLDSSTFSDVQRVFGPGSQSPQPENAPARDRLCYKVNGDKDVYVGFEAGLSDYPDHGLSSFELSYGNFLQENPYYNLSSISKSAIATGSGLQLGITKSDLIQLIGKPSKAERDWLVYIFEDYQAYSQPDQDSVPPFAHEANCHRSGQYNYSWVFAHFSSEKMDYLCISVGSETDW